MYLVDPFKSHNKISKTNVTGVPEIIGIVLKVKVAEDIETMVYRNKDDVSVMCQIEAVKGDFLKGIASEESASVDPYKDGLLLTILFLRRPNVDVLAILALLLEHVQTSVIRKRIGLT